MMPDPTALKPAPHPGMSNKLLSSILAAICGLALGSGVNLGGVFVEHYGPSVGPFAFNGNGAIIVPRGLGPLLLALGIVLLARRRAYLPMGIYIVAFVVGFMAANVAITLTRA